MENAVIGLIGGGRPGTLLLPGRITLQWRHNGRDGVSNNQPHDCLPFFILAQIKEDTIAPRHWPLGNSPMTGEFPTQMASNAENVFIWWRHHDHAAQAITLQSA